MKRKGSIFNKTTSILFLLIFPVGFLFLTQPTGIFAMESEKTKSFLIVLLAFNFTLFHYIFILLLSFYKKFSNKNLIKLHFLTTIVVIITTLIILYALHPYMMKKYLWRFFLSSTVIAGIFQMIAFYFLKPFYTPAFVGNNTNLSKKIIISDNKTTLNLSEDELLFVKSDGNYIEVVTKSDKYLIRSSIKKILDANPDTVLLRCHKSYIVNRSKIKSIQGNSKNYSLILSDYHSSIPVSRNIGKEIKSILSL